MGRFCRAAGARLPAALHVDTGMNRLGLCVEEALALEGGPAPRRLRAGAPDEPFRQLRGCRPIPLNARQIAAFEAVRARLSGRARLAQQLVGHLPAAGAPLRPRPARLRPLRRQPDARPRQPDARRWCGLEARVIQVRDVAGRRDASAITAHWTAPGPRRLATLSVGYADGYPRAASATDAKVAAGAPSARPSSPAAAARSPAASPWTSSSVDVTDVPAGAVGRGDLVTLIGDDLTIDEVGRRRRHHRLRDPHRPRPPLRAALYRWLTRCVLHSVLYGALGHDFPASPSILKATEDCIQRLLDTGRYDKPQRRRPGSRFSCWKTKRLRLRQRRAVSHGKHRRRHRRSSKPDAVSRPSKLSTEAREHYSTGASTARRR